MKRSLNDLDKHLESINFKPILSLGACLVLSSCILPGEKQVMKDDIAQLQAQMVNVSNTFKEQGKDISTRSNQHAASTNTRIDSIVRDLQKIKGDIDALRVGVVTGKMPGMIGESEGSVANSLELLDARLKEIEDQQQRILEVVEKASAKKKEKKQAEKETKINSLNGLDKAFKEKRFRHVAENAAAVLKKQKSSSDKQRALYLYAESLYKLGNLREAALKFNDYLELKPKENNAHAKLRLGDCFRHLGDKATAKLFYEDLITSHKDSSEAKTAEERLAKL